MVERMLVTVSWIFILRVLLPHNATTGISRLKLMTSMFFKLKNNLSLKKQILWPNQIWPEMAIFDRKWILNFENMASIPCPYKKRWQAYLIRNKTDMASMSSPLCHRHDKHTWSPLLLTWQAYLVRYKMDMASMFSPLYNQYGKHTWSLSRPKWQSYLVHPYTLGESWGQIYSIRIYVWMRQTYFYHIKNFQQIERSLWKYIQQDLDHGQNKKHQDRWQVIV